MSELIVARAAENKTQSIFCWRFVENNSLSEGLAGFTKAGNRHRCESFKEGVRQYWGHGFSNFEFFLSY